MLKRFAIPAMPVCTDAVRHPLRTDCQTPRLHIIANINYNQIFIQLVKRAKQKKYIVTNGINLCFKYKASSLKSEIHATNIL